MSTFYRLFRLYAKRMTITNAAKKAWITQHVKTLSAFDKCNWVAVFDNYEESDVQGWGDTEDTAIADLMEKSYKGEIE